MFKEIKEKVVYDFLHIVLSGHLKRDELSNYMKDYLAQSPMEFRAHVMENMVLLQDTFEVITSDVMCKYEIEHEKWEEEDIMKMVASYSKVHKMEHKQKSRFFTIGEAAKMLKVTSRTVHNYSKQGKLKKEVINEKSMITGDSVRALLVK